MDPQHAGQLPGPGQPRAGGRQRLVVVPGRQARLDPRDHDIVGLGLYEHRQQGGRETSGDIATGHRQVPLSPESQADEQGALRQVVADSVQVDTGGRFPVAPPRQLAVGTVEDQVQLDQHRPDHGRRQTAERDHDAGRDPACDERDRDRVWRPAKPGEHPGGVRGQLAAVEPAQPVLVVEPVEHRLRLAFLPELSQRWP